MEVTEVRIRQLHMPKDSGNKMRAVVSVTLDNEFVVHDIKVIQGEEHYFIAMPSRKVENGRYRDITHPIKPALRDKMQDAILASYENALAAMRLKAVQSTLGSGDDGVNIEQREQKAV